MPNRILAKAGVDATISDMDALTNFMLNVLSAHLRGRGGFTEDQIYDAVMNIWESELADDAFAWVNATENKSQRLNEFLNECKTVVRKINNGEFDSA